MEKINEMEKKREKFKEIKRRNDPRMVNISQAFEVEPDLDSKFQQVIKETFAPQHRDRSSDYSISKQDVKSKRDSVVFSKESSSMLINDKRSKQKEKDKRMKPRVKFSQQMIEQVFSDYDPNKNKEVNLNKSSIAKMKALRKKDTK